MIHQAAHNQPANLTALRRGVQRYGFNGVEKDSPDKGFYNTTFRKYDARIGKWLSIDPVNHYSESPYGAFYSNPIIWNDPNGDCPACRFFVKGVKGIWTATSRKAFLSGAQRGKWVKVTSNNLSKSRREAEKVAKDVYGEYVEHTNHTIGSGSNKITKPHFQPKNNSELDGGKVFYQASLALIVGEESEYSWGEFGEDVFEVTLVTIVESLFGGISTANAPAPLMTFPNVSIGSGPQPISSATTGFTSSEIGNDVDGDGKPDDEDFICNACGEGKENLILLGGSNWAVLEDRHYCAYDNYKQNREEAEGAFREYESEFNEIVDSCVESEATNE